MSKRKDGSELAAAGLTLAQIGAEVCNAVKDAGGNDQLAKMILYNRAMATAVGDAIMHPRWEVVSDKDLTESFIERQLQRPMDIERTVYPMVLVSNNIRYKLRGSVVSPDYGLEHNISMMNQTKFTPLEVAILLRNQISVGQLGFAWAVVTSEFKIGDIVYSPVLLDSGALVWWKSDSLKRGDVPAFGVIISLESEERV